MPEYSMSLLYIQDVMRFELLDITFLPTDYLMLLSSDSLILYVSARGSLAGS